MEVAGPDLSTVRGGTPSRRPETAAPRVARGVVVAVPVLFLAVLFVWPLTAIVARGLAPAGQLDLTAVGRVLADPEFADAVWFTFWQATVSTLATLVIGLPGAYVFARYDFWGRRAVLAALTVAFVLPTVVVAVAFRTLLRPVGLEEGLFAILAAHVFFNYVVVVRVVGALWRNLDPALTGAARTLGATRVQTFVHVTLPLLWPAIASAAAITFLFTFTSFGIVLLLGGPGYATVEVLVWRTWTQDLDAAAATTMALIQLAAVAVVLVIAGRFQQRRAAAMHLRPVAATARRPRTRRERLLVAANLAVPVLLVGTPLLVLLARSFSTPAGWGLGAYRALAATTSSSVLAVPPIEAVRNSIVFASVATCIAVVVGGCAAWAVSRPGRHGGPRRLLDVALMLPLAASAVTVALGFLVAFDRPPFDWRTSPALIPLAHALVAMPFVVRLLVPVLVSVDARLRDAAATLGASPWQVWREVDLPLVWRALLVAAGFAFCVSLGEFGATLFLARPDLPTIPVAIARLLSRPGPANLGQAVALGAVLMAVTAAAVLALERVRTRELGEF